MKLVTGHYIIRHDETCWLVVAKIEAANRLGFLIQESSVSPRAAEYYKGEEFVPLQQRPQFPSHPINAFTVQIIKLF